MQVRPSGRHGDDVVLASMQTPGGLKPRRARRATAAAPVGAAIKPFDGSNVFLFTPSPAYRMRYVPSPAVPIVPEYPPVGARIDYYLASPSGEVKLDILDADRHSRAQLLERSARARRRGRGGGRRGGGLPSTLPTKVGMNRFVWDLRYPGGPPASGGDMEGGGFGGGGPLVAPGTYQSAPHRGRRDEDRTFTVKIDPRVAKDGVTVADLAEQTKFALKVRDALAEARQLSQRVRQAMEAKRGDQAKLQSISDGLVTKSGPYEDQMFIDQLSNVEPRDRAGRPESRRERLRALQRSVKEWAAIKAEAEAAGR